LFDRLTVPLPSIHAIADRLEMLGAKRTRERGAVSAGENPVDVRILRRIQHAQRVPGAIQDGRGDIYVDVAEELRIPSKASHHGPREEHPEEQAPAPGVPALQVEAQPLVGGPWLQKIEDGAPVMYERQNTMAKQREVPLEFAEAADAVLDGCPLPIPELAGGRAERRLASIEQLRAARREARSHAPHHVR